MIGAASTKTTVTLVRTGIQESGKFGILEQKSIDFSADSGDALLNLLKCVRPVLQQWMQAAGEGALSILKCSDGGLRSASGPAFKAEGVVQMVASELEMETSFINPQALPKKLGCEKGQKWQDRAKELLNPDGQLNHWANIQKAAAAAYDAVD